MALWVPLELGRPAELTDAMPHWATIGAGRIAGLLTSDSTWNTSVFNGWRKELVVLCALLAHSLLLSFVYCLLLTKLKWTRPLRLWYWNAREKTSPEPPLLPNNQPEVGSFLKLSGSYDAEEGPCWGALQKKHPHRMEPTPKKIFRMQMPGKFCKRGRSLQWNKDNQPAAHSTSVLNLQILHFKNNAFE